MGILLDKNVVLDYILVRKPNYDDVVKLINCCLDWKMEIYIAVHSLTAINNSLKRKFPPDECQKLLLSVTDFFTVTAAPHNSVVDAINNEKFPDLEDCLQEKCALEVGADYIVTNNFKDFAASEIPAVTPAEMIEIICNS